MYSAKDLKKYDEGMVTDLYIYDKCDTDLDMYNFYGGHCGMSESGIKDAMRNVSGADDAYYNALDLAEYDDEYDDEDMED